MVEELKAELPGLRRFATLSPVPGFSAWLTRQAAEARVPPLGADEVAALSAAASGGQGDWTDMLQRATQGEWWNDPARAELLRGPLLGGLAAMYLTRDAGSGRIDPVARFHLGNGARLERIDWLGNTSLRGLRESLGIMVNYLYDPETIEANHESFVKSGRVARSGEVEGLVKGRK